LSWNSNGGASVTFISLEAKKQRMASFTQALTSQPVAAFCATRMTPRSSSATVSFTAIV
jgi:hypothetical protein